MTRFFKLFPAVLMAASFSVLTGCAGDAVDGGAPDDPESAGAADALSGVHQAMATHFDGLGTPYGGCGVPQSVLESQNFVALNVQNTPNDYTSFLQRPIADATKVGTWNNGGNCGRWVRVTIGNHCTGVNSGVPGTPFCQGGNWVADSFNNATLDMLVADSCQDNNRWCRDDRFHLDLSTASLTRFRKNGVATTGLPNAWGNRQISWQFIAAPGYSGDIRVGFHQDAAPNWPAVIVTHLPNGIHGVEQLVNGTWTAAKMLGDNGQAFQLTPGATFHIRVRDVNNNLIQNGRTYTFGFPSSCGGRCSGAFTEVKYTTT